MRETTFGITRGGNKEIDVLKLPRLCPLVLPVNVSWWQDERVGENEGGFKRNRKILFCPVLFDIRYDVM